MDYVLLQVFGSILSFFQYNSGETVYFYYDAILLALLLVGIAFSAIFIIRNAKRSGNVHLLLLLAVVVAFAIVEIAFVHPTTQLYNDEFIHMSIAKSIIYDQNVGICSFSNEPHCVSGTAGLFQQPTGWAMMLSISFLLFGISFATAFNLVLLLSCLSVLLVFYISFILFNDRNVAVLSAALFAFTPLFLTFSRSAIIDTPELTVFLIALALLLTYIREKKIVLGLAACAAVAYALIMKVDAILTLPIMLAFLLLLGIGKYGGLEKKRKELAILALVLIILITPQLIFLYNSWSANRFGAPPSTPRFSLGNFEGNFLQNAGFWLSRYGDVFSPYSWQSYNLEYPIAYTVFAIIGLLYILRGKQWNVGLALVCWFALVFVFYTSYYAGGALYSAGDDIRYFMLAFPAMAILASTGILRLASTIAKRIEATKWRKRTNKKISMRTIVAIALLVIVFTGVIFEFAVFVAKPPQSIYPFAAERFQQQVILGNYTLIPRSCFVLSYEPPLWNVLNVSNIYADWFFIPQYTGTLLNLSKGCLYFEYSLDCVVNTGGYGLDNTTPGCSKILNTFNMSPVVVAPYNKFGWAYNFTIYKINSYKNGSRLFK